MTNYRKMTFVFTIMALLLMVATVGAEEKKLSGTVHIENKQLMFIVGGDFGHGTLEFKGEKYTFTTSGITAGGVGYQNMSASGKVYDLNKVEDFPGTYFAARVGLTVGGGAGEQWLKNENGVYIDLKSTQEGAALGFGLEGLTIKMKE